MRARSTQPASQGVRQALLAAALLIALQVAAKSTRDALYCAAFSPAELPRVMTAGALLSMGFALGAARLFRVFGPGKAVPGLLLVSAVGFGIEYILLPVSPRPVALILYLHVAAVGAVVVSGFWSVVSERFDPHALRTSMPRIGFGATLGGLTGGLFAERIAATTNARSTLVGLLVLSMAGAAAVAWFSRPVAPAKPGPSEPAPSRALGSPYVYWLSAFVLLTALTSSIVDFGFKARAMERFTSAEALVQFFGLFYTATSLLALLVQAFVTPRLLEREGLDVALAALPASLIASGVGALLVPGLGAQILLKGIDGGLGNSLYRSAYEPLYTPMPAKTKRASKAVIDVVVDKLGDALGSLVVWILVLAVPATAAFGATAAAVVVALLSLLLTVRLHRGYVAELAESLRTGSFQVDEADVRDKTTRLTLSRTQLEVDRERLLADIQSLRERGQLSSSPVASRESSDHAAERGVWETTALWAQIRDLGSNDPSRIKQAMAQGSFDHRSLPFLIPLLGRDDVGGETMNLLAGLGESVTGQLADALLSRELSTAKVRRRLARILGTIGGERAAHALSSALADPEFDVRRQVARGLSTIRRTGVTLPVERGAIVALALQELRDARQVGAEMQIEHAFTLLGLVQDPEALGLSYRALSSSDLKLRGTALEYLENVLPANVRAEIDRLIRVERLPARPRGEGELLAELKRTLG